MQQLKKMPMTACGEDRKSYCCDNLEGYHDMIRRSTTASVSSVMIDLITVSALRLFYILGDSERIGSRTINAKDEPFVLNGHFTVSSCSSLRCEMLHGRSPEVSACLVQGEVDLHPPSTRPKAMLLPLAMLTCTPKANITDIHTSPRLHKSNGRTIICLVEAQVGSVSTKTLNTEWNRHLNLHINLSLWLM